MMSTTPTTNPQLGEPDTLWFTKLSACVRIARFCFLHGEGLSHIDG